ARALASDGKTLAVLAHDDGDWSVSIWSLDGKTKVREEKILPARFSDSDEAPRLLPLHDGYLFVANEVTWIPAVAEGKIRRFALQPAPGPMSGFVPPTAVHFFPPVLTPNRIVVAAADGAVYVFDTARFAKSD